MLELLIKEMNEKKEQAAFYQQEYLKAIGAYESLMKLVEEMKINQKVKESDIS